MPDEFDAWLEQELRTVLPSEDAAVPARPRYLARVAPGAPRRRWGRLAWPATRAGVLALLSGAALATGSVAAAVHAVDPSLALIPGGGSPSATSCPGGSLTCSNRANSGSGPVAKGDSRTPTSGAKAAAGGNSHQSPGSGSPGNSGSAPGQGSGSPGNSGNAPGQGSGSPGNSGSAPGQGGGSPGNSGNAPGQGSGSPGNSGNAPGHGGPNPGRGGG